MPSLAAGGIFKRPLPFLSDNPKPHPRCWHALSWNRRPGFLQLSRCPSLFSNLTIRIFQLIDLELWQGSFFLPTQTGHVSAARCNMVFPVQPTRRAARAASIERADSKARRIPSECAPSQPARDALAAARDIHISPSIPASRRDQPSTFNMHWVLGLAQRLFSGSKRGRGSESYE